LRRPAHPDGGKPPRKRNLKIETINQRAVASQNGRLRQGKVSKRVRGQIGAFTLPRHRTIPGKTLLTLLTQARPWAALLTKPTIVITTATRLAPLVTARQQKSLSREFAAHLVTSPPKMVTRAKLATNQVTA
jgi:hypothetical protein